MFCSFEHCIDSNTRTLALQTTPTHAAPTHAHYSFSPTTLSTCSSTCSPVSSSSPTVCAHIVAPSVPRDLRPTCWHISARNLERRWVSLHTECFLHSILHSKNKCICRTDSFFSLCLLGSKPLRLSREGMVRPKHITANLCCLCEHGFRLTFLSCLRIH